MGDRANIYVVDRRPAAADDTETIGIYLYTHWNGSDWPELLREALAQPIAQRRWNDPSYLTKIVADFLFKDSRDSETGCGISTEIGDNSYPITILDVANGTVSFAAEGEEENRNNWQHTMPIPEFAAQEAATYPADMLD
jgi:hypothetical protein